MGKETCGAAEFGKSHFSLSNPKMSQSKLLNILDDLEKELHAYEKKVLQETLNLEQILDVRTRQHKSALGRVAEKEMELYEQRIELQIYRAAMSMPLSSNMDTATTPRPTQLHLNTDNPLEWMQKVIAFMMRARPEEHMWEDDKDRIAFLAWLVFDEEEMREWVLERLAPDQGQGVHPDAIDPGTFMGKLIEEIMAVIRRRGFNGIL